jgi:hypothetical protein
MHQQIYSHNNQPYYLIPIITTKIVIRIILIIVTILVYLIWIIILK